MTLPDRYPGYDCLSQRGHWDTATRRVVMDRVYNVPDEHNLDPHARATLEAFCDRVIPQGHRPPDRRVPIAPWIDAHSREKVLNGYLFEDMPTNDEAWRLGLDGLDQTADTMFGRQFVELDGEGQDAVLNAVRAGNPQGAVWQRLPAGRWWSAVALAEITGVYYAHPFAWDEIGFGGPAYPRGYFALNHGAREPWEVDEAPVAEGGEAL